jgi:hypothetical protein
VRHEALRKRVLAGGSADLCHRLWMCHSILCAENMPSPAASLASLASLDELNEGALVLTASDSTEHYQYRASTVLWSLRARRQAPARSKISGYVAISTWQDPPGGRKANQPTDRITGERA